MSQTETVDHPENAQINNLVVRDKVKNQIENLIYSLLTDLALSRGTGIRGQYDDLLGETRPHPTGAYILVNTDSDNVFGRLRETLDLYEKDFLRHERIDY